MIRYCEGDIFESGAEALVNPVNCVGVMGAGLARQFKGRFPDNWRRYRQACRVGDVRPGKVLVVWPLTGVRRWIVNFPTKDHWKDPSSLEWIADGLSHLRSVAEGSTFRSMAIPMIGCGLGGLDWADVRPLIESAFAELPGVDVMVYGPPR